MGRGQQQQQKMLQRTHLAKWLTKFGTPEAISVYTCCHALSERVSWQMKGMCAVWLSKLHFQYPRGFENVNDSESQYVFHIAVRIIM